MHTRAKLLLVSLGFAGLPTGLAVMQSASVPPTLSRFPQVSPKTHFTDTGYGCTPPLFIPGREEAQGQYVSSFTLSPQKTKLLVLLDRPARQVPDQEFWQALLPLQIPVAYKELWTLSRWGEPPHCLLREPIFSTRVSSYRIGFLDEDNAIVLRTRAEETTEEAFRVPLR